MTHPAPSRPARSADSQAWRAVLEVAAFAIAAAVLLTGPRIGTLGQALARLQAPFPVAQPEGRKPLPAAGVRKAPAAQAPSRAASPAPAKSVVIPDAPVSSATRPKSRGESAARRTGGAPPAAAATPPAAVARIQHFYNLMDNGIALYRAGWYGPALARFRQAAAAMPDSPYAHLWRGRAAVQAQRADEAREALERAIALAPGTEVARQAQALLLQLD